MKKFVNIILTVLMICTLCTTAFAEDAPAPTEISPDKDGRIKVRGNCIINQPDEVQAKDLYVNSGGTLTIAENVTVKVCGDTSENEGTIIVYGTLDLRGSDKHERSDRNGGTIVVYGTLIVSEEWESILNDGKVIVYGTLVSDDEWGKFSNLEEGKVILADCCGGEMIGEFNFYWGEPEHVDHYFYNGVCGCGEVDPTAVGFTISKGNTWTIAGIAVIAVVTISVVVARKKKKSALVSGTENTDEE